jgi:cell division protein FtsW (lipid II flippase)
VLKLRLSGPGLWELALLLAVLVGLVWQFQGLRAGNSDAPEESRYALDETLRPGPLTGYGQAKIDTLCQHVNMPPRLQWRWASACKESKAELASDLATLPGAMQADYEALQRAVIAGDSERQARSAPSSKSLAEGVLPEKDREQLKANLRELALYRGRFQMAADAQSASAGSLPLACAWSELQVQASRASTDEDKVIVMANQLALVRGAASRLWWPRTIGAQQQVNTPGPAWSLGIAQECHTLGTPHRTVAQAADMVEQIRLGERLQHKARAMQSLQAKAPWLLVAWALSCWFLLSLVRVTQRPARYVPVALILWAAVGAASGLHLQDNGVPVPWVIWAGIAALGFALWLGGRLLPVVERIRVLGPSPAQHNVLFLSLPLFVLFVGMGWWLVFDLALNGHYHNRYIALSQSLPVFGAFVLLTLMPALSHGLAKLWVAWASLVTNALRPQTSGPLSGWLRPVAIWMVYAIVVFFTALVLKNWRQFTGEAFRWWLLLGVSWFFLLRAAHWGGRQIGGWRWLLTSMLPMLVHVLVIMGALVMTDDLGPLLVVLFASAVYLGAFAAQALLGRSTGWAASMLTGIVVAACAVALLLGGLYGFAKLPIGPAQRVAERVESVLSPFSAENDQLAHVLWFQKHTPPDGYGLGAVPWCGTLPASNCQGMPAQTQSDYTFSALLGVTGYATAFGLLAVYLWWLGLLAVRQAAQTKGKLNLAALGATESAWLAWLAVCWVVLTVVQSLVTVMGNLGALPLTGVTWAFVSFGSWSLLGNALFLGLVMHRLETAE